jgi:hypothetical protein
LVDYAAICYILLPFGLFFGYLVYFFPVFTKKDLATLLSRIVSAHFRLVDVFEVRHQVALFVELVVAVRALERDVAPVNLLQVVLQVGLVGVLLAADVTRPSLQALVHNLEGNFKNYF